jgi:O-antigen ligase
MAEIRFFKSLPYFLILSLITLVFWYLKLDMIGMTIFAFLATIMLIFNRDGFAVLPFFLNMMFMISETEWSLATIPIYLYILPIFLIIGLTVHIIRFKVKIFTGKLKYPLLLLFLAMLLSSFNVEDFTINYLFYCLIGVFYLFIYFYFRGSLDGDNLDDLIKLFAVIGVMIALQVLIYYLRVDDVIYALENKRIDLGWGLSNTNATYLVMFISILVYYVKKHKFNYLLVILLSFEILMLLFTLSRGGILTFVITLIPLIIFLFYGYKNKLKMAMNIIIGLVVIGLVVWLRTDIFETIWLRLLDRGFDDTGRFAIWIEAWEMYKTYPLFGGGLFARVSNDYFSLYHNTILHTMATLGTVGLIAIIWQFIEIFKVFFKKLTSEKAILAIMLIAANIHGMLENVYYMPQFMLIFFIVIAAVENHNIEVLKVGKI